MRRLQTSPFLFFKRPPRFSWGLVAPISQRPISSCWKSSRLVRRFRLCCTKKHPTVSPHILNPINETFSEGGLLGNSTGGYSYVHQILPKLVNRLRRITSEAFDPNSTRWFGKGVLAQTITLRLRLIGVLGIRLDECLCQCLQ